MRCHRSNISVSVPKWDRIVSRNDRKLLFIAWCRSSKPHHGPFTFQLFRKIKAEKCEENAKEAIFYSANNILQHKKPNTAFYLCECNSNLDM